MLQKIRDNAHGWWVYVIVPLLILMFALFGISNYLTGSMSQSDVAKVNGDNISYSDFAMIYQQLNQQQNPSQSKALASYIKLQVLQNLINQQLLYQALQNLGFAATPQVIDELIYQTPAFQVQGKFSMDQYQAVLQSMGFTTQQLRDNLLKSYLIQQLQTGLMSSEFALPSESTRETMLANMVRDVTYVTIDPASFAERIQVSDSDVANYYQNHQSQFMTPYQLQLQYLTLSLSQFSKQFKDSAQAQAAFQNAVNSLANVSFQNPDSLTAAANMLKVPVQTTGWLSSDSKSGLFANPQVLAAAMSDDVLQKGNNSNVINLDKNTVMVLRVVNKKAPTLMSLAQVTPQIKKMLVMQQALALAEAQAKNLQASVNADDSLAIVANKAHLPVANAQGISIASKNLNQGLLNAFNQAGVGQALLTLSNNKVIVFQVNKVYVAQKLVVKVPPEALVGLWSQIEMSSFLAHQQFGAKIKMNDALLKAQ